MSDVDVPDWAEDAVRQTLYGGRYDRKQMIDAIEAIIRSNGLFRASAEQIVDLLHSNPSYHSSMSSGGLSAKALHWGDGVEGLLIEGTEHLGVGHSHHKEVVVFLGTGEEAEINRARIRAALDGLGVCARCGGSITFNDSPGGSWWSHVVHPADEHDAEAHP